MFVLQSRGIAHADERKIKPIPIDIDINVSSEVGLRYCPFCGCQLDPLLQRSPQAFEKLADEHEALLVPVQPAAPGAAR